METKHENKQLIDKLFGVGAHYGLSASRRHPSSKGYLFGAKGGVEIFDLEKTATLLSEALDFMAKLASQRQVVLFVGGKAEARESVRRAAEALSQPYVAGRWIGGTLTNWSEIKKRLNRLQELTEMREDGSLGKFTKRERLLIDREITDLEAMFGGLRGMTKLPDALFIVDPRAEEGAVMEAAQLNIPVIALMNSDCDAKHVAHPIPGNDASRDTIGWVLDEVKDAYAKNLGALPTPGSAADAK